MPNDINLKNIPDDGYIKFQCKHTQTDWGTKLLPISSKEIEIIKHIDIFRTKLFDQQFIGIYENGIGYGNLSHRLDTNTFIITASATGGARELGINGYTKVTNVDINSNTVQCLGPLPASSETMSHAVVYETSPKINCVLHIHNLEIFNTLIEKKALSTASHIPYGTVEMALAIKQIVVNNPLEACIVMQGHQEGILFYGININHIETQLAFICREIKQNQCNKCKKGDKND